METMTVGMLASMDETRLGMRYRATNHHVGRYWVLALLLCLWSGFVLAQATLIAEYRFDDVAWCSPSQALDTVGGRHGSLVGAVAWEDSPASGGKPVNGAAARFAGIGAIDVTGLPLSTASGAKTSVSFWMYWDGTNNVMPLGFGWHDLWINGGSFGFNTFNSDIYGIASAGLANGWHHVAAVFTNGNVHANQLWIDGVPQTLTQRASSPNNANAVVSPHLRLSGVWGTSGYQFSGALDVVRVYSGAITQAQVDADRTYTQPPVACPPPPPPTLVTHYRLDDNWDVTHSTANDVTGGPPGAFFSPYASKVAAPATPPRKPNTCSGAQFTPGKGSMRSTGNALDTNVGGKNSVTFWMYWQGQDNQMPFGFQLYDLWLVNGYFGFNTGNSDVYGISSAGLANGWHHVAAVFTNGNVHANKLWIDGIPQTLSQKQSSPNNPVAYASGTFQLSSWTNNDNYRFHGIIDEVRVYRGALDDAAVQRDMAASCHTLLAEWRMDEAGWNGTSAGEVKDSSGHGYDGTVGGLSSIYPSTDGASPAIPGSPGTCRYGVFDRTRKQYVVLPGFPNLGTNSFTITAWIRTRNNTQSGQRIFIDDENNAQGYGFSLGDGGTGRLRFFSRGTSSALILDTGNVIENNTWYFVAAIADVPNKTKHIFAFDATGTLLTHDTKGWSEASFGFDAGPASIGGETNASGENSSSFGFNGNLDEIRIFEGSLSASELDEVRRMTRPCALPLHHHRIEAGATGLTCQREAVTFKACADASCATLYTGGDVQINLSPTNQWYASASGGSPLGNPQTIPASGMLTLYLQQTTPATVMVSATHAGGPAPTGSPAVTCNNDTTAAPCNIAFAEAGLIFTATNASPWPEATIPNQTAGVAFPTSYYLRAVMSDKTTGACVAAVQGTRSVDFGRTCVDPDPAHCDSGNHLAPASQNLTFDANGVTTTAVQFNYKDVGRIKLTARTTSATGGALAGESNPFVVKPHHFELSDLVCSDGTTNPAAASASGARFCKAGQSFTLNVSAHEASNAVTPSYGKEATPESVKLASTLVSGLGLTNNPAPVGSFAAFGQKCDGSPAPGWACGTFQWDEVGIITLTPSVGDGDYLGAGDVSGNASGNVGRFYPHHFDTSATPGCGSFTYSGQPFPLTVTAKNAAGLTTQNYAGSFAKTVTLTDANGTAGAFSPPSLAPADFVAGEANKTSPPSVKFTFGNKLTAPATLKVRASDGEASSATGSEGSLPVRSGRLRLVNFYGSELLKPRVEYRVEYWDGSRWAVNAADTCTSLAAANIATGGLAAPSVGALSSGIGFITFNTAPAGSYDIAVNLNATGSDTSCNLAHGGTAANLPWLQGHWSASCGGVPPWQQDPNARVRLGSPKAPYIYLRERY